MKEVNFKDRVPKYPGRITLTPVEGQTNTYELTRADEPTEPGTPLDKATFNSIIHSRLTGRYYVPSVTYGISASSQTGLTVSPIPTSGWVYDTDNNRATSGTFVVEVDSNNGSAWLASGAFSSNGWQNMGGDDAWLTIYHAQKIKLRNLRFAVEFQYSARFSKLEIQGSNNGTTWTTVGELTEINAGVLTEYALGAPGEYSYYRLYFTNSDSNRITVKSLSYTLYDINTYTNKFTLAEGVPGTFTEEQRLLIKTPSVVATFAVTSNSLNEISINTILQPNKRYELRYNGSAFDAKEV